MRPRTESPAFWPGPLVRFVTMKKKGECWRMQSSFLGLEPARARQLIAHGKAVGKRMTGPFCPLRLTHAPSFTPLARNSGRGWAGGGCVRTVPRAGARGCWLLRPCRAQDMRYAAGRRPTNVPRERPPIQCARQLVARSTAWRRGRPQTLPTRGQGRRCVGHPNLCRVH